MSPLLNHLVSGILLLPLAGAMVLLAVNGRRPGIVRAVAGTFAAAACALSLALWFLYEPHGKTWQFAERVAPIPSIGASYYVGADGFSIVFILIMAFAALLAIAAAWSSVRDRVRACHILVLILLAAVMGVCVALDLLLLFASWTAALASAYFLMRAAAGDAGRAAARAFLPCAIASSAFVLAGIVMLYFGQPASGARTFDVTLLHTVSLAPAVQTRVFVALALGFALAVPMVPFHRWLRGAFDGVPAAASLLIALALVSMGTYGALRLVLPIAPDASRALAPAIAAIAVAAGLYAAARMILQRGWTRRAAWSISSVASLALAGAYAIAIDGVGPRAAAVIYPAPLQRRVETAVGRVVGRVHPELAPGLPRGSDCATPAPPEPAGPPAGFVLTAPCADGSDAARTPAPPQPVPR